MLWVWDAPFSGRNQPEANACLWMDKWCSSTTVSYSMGLSTNHCSTQVTQFYRHWSKWSKWRFINLAHWSRGNLKSQTVTPSEQTVQGFKHIYCSTIVCFIPQLHLVLQKWVIMVGSQLLKQCRACSLSLYLRLIGIWGSERLLSWCTRSPSPPQNLGPKNAQARCCALISLGLAVCEISAPKQQGQNLRFLIRY